MEEKEKAISEKDLDWENRRLCIDEACIGVIGPDGRCKECSKPENTENREIETPEPIGVVNEKHAEAELEMEAEPPSTDTDSDWENRRLCTDEACIGVIGPDGHCKECGKPAGLKAE